MSAYAYTFLDNVAYRYVIQDSFCFNGSTGTSHSPNHWIDNVDPNYYWRGGSVVSEQWIWTGYWTEMQGQVESCVFKYGCLGVAYRGAGFRAMVLATGMVMHGLKSIAASSGATRGPRSPHGHLI